MSAQERGWAGGVATACTAVRPRANSRTPGSQWAKGRLLTWARALAYPENVRPTASADSLHRWTWASCWPETVSYVRMKLHSMCQVPGLSGLCTWLPLRLLGWLWRGLAAKGHWPPLSSSYHSQNFGQWELPSTQLTSSSCDFMVSVTRWRGEPLELPFLASISISLSSHTSHQCRKWEKSIVSFLPSQTVS